jgi:outer membrane receptor protein involved in Fe transport
LNARFFRELRPSGDGLLDTTGLNVGWNQQIVPRWRWLLNANAYRNERPSGGSSGVDRDYFSITPRVRYALDRDWSLGAGYRYRYQKYDKDSDSAEANAVFFTIDYEPGREWLDLDLTR